MMWLLASDLGNLQLAMKPRQGSPETCLNEEIEKYLYRNARAACSEIGYELNCDESTVRKKLHGMNS